MPIIAKETEDGFLGLFDTRSEKFLRGGGMKNPNDVGLVEIANDVIRKSSRNLYDLAFNYIYTDDNGYVESMVAERYLELNPDLKEKGKLSIKEKAVRKSRKKPVEESDSTEIKIRGKSGRPKRVYTEEELAGIEAKKDAPKRGRGRPKGIPKEPREIVLINGQPRKRGRPAKIQN